MKKQIIKNILIIVLGVFIIIPLISMIFNIDFSRQEGFASDENSDVTLTSSSDGSSLTSIPYDFGMTLDTTGSTYSVGDFALKSATLSETGDITSNLTYTSGAFTHTIPTLTYGETLTDLTLTNTNEDFTFTNKSINYPFSLTDSNGVVTSIDLNNSNVGDTIGTITTDTTNYTYSLPTNESYFEIDGLNINVKDRTLTTTPYPLTITRDDGNGNSDIPLTFNITIIAFDAAAATTTESTTTETTTTYSDSTNMHRVDISGVNVQHESEVDVSYTGLPGEFLYCPAGEIICQSGEPVLKSSSYTLPNGQTSNTYEYLCSIGGGHVECSGNRLADGKNITLMSNCLNSLGNTTTNKYYGLTNTTTTARVDSGVRVTFEGDDSFAGFTDPFKYIPFEISGNNAYVYDTSQALLFTSDNCGVYENDDCFEEVTASCDDSTSSSTDDGTCPKIQCLADNGSEKGGPLCCGQSGVLQNTKYNCPADYPFCVGYKCGESWGTCQASAS